MLSIDHDIEYSQKQRRGIFMGDVGRVVGVMVEFWWGVKLD